MNVLIPKVICFACKVDMIVIEGTNKRVCRRCEKEVTIEVIEE